MHSCTRHQNASKRVSLHTWKHVMNRFAIEYGDRSPVA